VLRGSVRGAGLIILALTFTLAFTACSASRLNRPKEGCFQSQPRPVLSQLRDGKSLFWPVAHRGGKQFGAPNLNSTVLNAARAGMPLIEVDVRESADGALFLFHDRRLSADNAIISSQLYGEYFSNLYSTSIRQLMVPGSFESPPLLQTVLANIRNFSSVLLLDVKGDWALSGRKAISLVAQLGMQSRVVFYCPSLQCIAELAKEWPEISFLLRVKKVADLPSALGLKPLIIQMDKVHLNATIVEQVRSAGSRLLVKALDSEDRAEVWRELEELGVDLVLTESPRSLWKQAHC
jgi:glycerophosphoryl diester phosphodiesterase